MTWKPTLEPTYWTENPTFLLELFGLQQVSQVYVLNPRNNQ